MAKKLVVSDFWLVVNGDWASCKSQTKIASCTTEKHNFNVTYNVLCARVCSLNLFYRDLAKSASRSYLEIASFQKNSPLTPLFDKKLPQNSAYSHSYLYHSP